MSLHQLAHHIQSKGRNGDDVLVHMTPGEVNGLQALAMAHGGSLTINPETGLPEAGFLKSLLPMLAGGALTVMSGGAINPMTAGLIVGAAGTAMTGSLGKGLMMGLGAYGGAGLGQGLSTVGAATQPVSATQLGSQSAGIAGAGQTVPMNQIFTGSGDLVRGVGTVPSAAPSALDTMSAGVKALGQPGGFSNLYEALPGGTLPALGTAALAGASDQKFNPPKQAPGMIRPYEYTRTVRPGSFDVGAPIYSATPGSSAEKNYFDERYTALTPYKAPGPEYAADGGLVALAVGGPVETMSAQNAVGSNMMYPQANLQTALYSNPMVQRPEAVNVIAPSGEPAVGAYSGEARFARGGVAEPEMVGGYTYDYNPQTMQFTELSRPQSAPPAGPFNLISRALSAGINTPQSQPTQPTVTGGIAPPAVTPAMSAQPAYTPPDIPAYQTPEQQLGLTGFYPMMERQLAALGAQGYAGGGLSHLGDYSDGGRLLKGPGDGVSDSIPAVIGNRQPARLADGEFVIPARIVSELGNGSTEAGARKLYAMMDRVQKARRKTVGKNRVAANTKAEKYLPA